jgi:hypothetical protein
MKFLIIVSISSFIFITGCGTVQDTIYLQQVEVTTPLNIPPLNLSSTANEGKVTVSPKFYFNDVKSVEGSLDHSPVNNLSQFEVDTIEGRFIPSSNNRYEYGQRNMRWNIPDYMIGVDLDLPLGKVVSVNTGFHVSTMDNTDLLGAVLGISLHTLADNSAIRFSGGLTWQQFKYTAETVVLRTTDPIFGEPETTAFFFYDENKETEMNFYFSLLYNTNFPEFPLNFYMGISYFRQTLFDFEPTTPDISIQPFYIYTKIDARGESSGGFLNLAPGIFSDISNWARIAGGVNFVFGTAVNNATETSFMLPFVKFEFFL